jgi:hypothetical protein
MHMLGLAAVC